VKMVRFLLQHLQANRVLLIIPIVMTFAQVGADILVAFPLKFILDKIINHQDPSFPGLSAMVGFFDRFGSREGLRPGEVHTELGVLVFSSCMIIVLGLVSAILSFSQLFLASWIGQNLSAHLRTHLFEHLQRLSLDWHGRQKKGDLVQRITGNIADVEKLIVDGLVDLLAGGLTLAGMVTVMFVANWRFTLLSVVVVPALFLIVLRYTRTIKTATRKAAKADGQVADIATEDIGAITEVKAFTLEEREAAHFRRYVETTREAGLRVGRLQPEFAPLVTMLLAVSTFTIVGVGAYVAAGHTFTLWLLTIPAGTLTVGTLTVFLTYLKQLYQPMRNLSKLMTVTATAASSAERIQEVLDEAPEVVESPLPHQGPTRLKGEITFTNVVFGYTADRLKGIDLQMLPGGEITFTNVVFGHTPDGAVLKGIDLQISPGRKIAIVGLSGSGKTTLVKLIPRFYEVWMGAVQIDGIDNREYPLRILRQNISLVLQDSVLFEGTIRDNIALGRPGASDREIVDAARKAHLHDMIRELPEGYSAHVREQGKNFSSGQRQRLAIARAILRSAPILILDEPTASLDVEAEAEVMRALDELVVGRTVLMISHRLSTLGQVDEIIVLHGGRIVEQGTFRELKGLGGTFARLLEEQNRYNIEGASPILPAAHAPRAGRMLGPRHQ